MEYITPKEVGELWGISERRVQHLCANGQIDGGKRLGGKVWVITAGASKPIDGRTRAAKQKVQQMVPENNTGRGRQIEQEQKAGVK